MLINEMIAEVRTRNPGVLIMFRIGDFYEAFGDDALVLAKVCCLAITEKNGRPLAVFPYYSLEPRLRELVKVGLRVGVCDWDCEKATFGNVVERVV